MSTTGKIEWCRVVNIWSIIWMRMLKYIETFRLHEGPSNGDRSRPVKYRSGIIRWANLNGWAPKDLQGSWIWCKRSSTFTSCTCGCDHGAVRAWLSVLRQFFDDNDLPQDRLWFESIFSIRGFTDAQDDERLKSWWSTRCVKSQEEYQLNHHHHPQDCSGPALACHYWWRRPNMVLNIFSLITCLIIVYITTVWWFDERICQRFEATRIVYVVHESSDAAPWWDLLTQPQIARDLCVMFTCVIRIYWCY